MKLRGYSNRPWTREEYETLLKMRGEGKTYAKISVVLWRSVTACQDRHDLLLGNLRKAHMARPANLDDQAPRRCLKCGDTFLSAHRGNRICSLCNVQIDEQRGSFETAYAEQ